MRPFVAAAAAAVVLSGLVPVASHALSAAPPARVDTHLGETLAAAHASDPLTVLVQGTTPAAARAGIAQAGLALEGELTSVGIVVATGTAEQVRALTTTRGITYVEQNRVLQTNLETSRKAIRAIEAMSTPGLQFDGTGETIAIVDGGTDGTHPMFARSDGTSKVVRNLRVACLDEVCPSGDSADPFLVDLTSVNDTDTEGTGGHGTHVAGIAAGVQVTTSDGHTFSGVAPGADVVAISSGLAIDIYAAAASLDWIARHHADPCGDGSCPPITVVNNSYGDSGGPWDPQDAISKIEEKLVGEGVTMVWANGHGDELNDGGDGSDNRSNPAGQAPFGGVISVANYDDADSGTRDGALDSSSSRGERTHPETWPDLSAPGTNITSACRPYLVICNSANADPNYGTISGTSMAAPHVAGAVAILQQAARAGIGRRLTPAEVENILEDSAHKFAFGGEYSADPTNPDSTSSYDKGHGLLDIVNALHLLQGTAPTAAPGACAPGAPLVTDASGDATAVAVADSGSNEPTLDVVGVDVAGLPADQLLIVSFRSADLSDANPSGTSSISFEGTLSIGDQTLDVTASRTSTGSTFTAGDAKVPGSFDAANETVTMLVPRAVLGGLYGSITVKGLSDGYSRRGYDPSPLAPVADSFSGACARTVDVGGTPPAPDGTAAPGAPYAWTGDPTTSVSDPAGLGDSATVEGEHEDVRRVQVNVPAGGTVTFESTCASPLDDYDLRLTGPDGKAIGKGTDVGTSENGGCDEKITVTNAPAGVYTATVVAFAAVHGSYDAKLSVT
jgi:serine protease AprX